jgi:hypothetical protein
VFEDDLVIGRNLFIDHRTARGSCKHPTESCICPGVPDPEYYWDLLAEIQNMPV